MGTVIARKLIIVPIVCLYTLQEFQANANVPGLYH